MCVCSNRCAEGGGQQAYGETPAAMCVARDALRDGAPDDFDSCHFGSSPETSTLGRDSTEKRQVLRVGKREASTLGCALYPKIR